jgi:hypothetical protein
MRNNVSEPLDRGAGRVLPERNMRSHLVIIDGIFRKDSAKVIRVEGDQMISALVPYRPDQRSAYPFCQGERNEVGRSRMRALNAPPNALSLSLRISPRRKWRRRDSLPSRNYHEIRINGNRLLFWGRRWGAAHWGHPLARDSLVRGLGQEEAKRRGRTESDQLELHQLRLWT